MIDLTEFSEKKSVSYWSGGKPANNDDFSIGESVVVKASDGAKKRCTFSKKLIDFLEKKLAQGEIHWASITRS